MSVDHNYTDHKTDIAIIGLSIRLPGVANVEDFWKCVVNGKEVIANIQEEDEEVLSPHITGLPGDSQFIKANTNIKGIEFFDASFFNFNLLEASWMDPQHRLFLELAWEALEVAGYTDPNKRGLTGVLASVYANYYSMFNLLPYMNSTQAASNLQMQIASEKDHVATMAAYKLDLGGPALNIQSACSSSLAAVHMACESLLTYSSDMMICGAATLGIPQLGGYVYQDNGLLSVDGHLRAFDEQATGTIYSDGAGCVVLKRFQDAWEDGDTILGVIKGSALNNDGSQKAGYTAPAVIGQIEVIERAMEAAGVSPEQISYIEAHGTGTPLGDAIELEALHEVFGRHSTESAYCGLGTTKANFGHTGPAAGVIGLIKTVMALREKVIPPAINVDMPSSRLATGNSPFYMNPIPLEWSSNGSVRYAGVSSFGLGGTNVHVILEEPPERTAAKLEAKPLMFTLSAKTPVALNRAKEEMHAFVSTASPIQRADVAYTLQTRRRAFEYRGFFTFGAQEEIQPGSAPAFRAGKVSAVLSPVRFVFDGNEGQNESNSSGWIQAEPVLQEMWTACRTSIASVVAAEPDLIMADIKSSVEHAVNALAMEIALAKVWTCWGIVATSYEGRGLGLYAAAVESGWMPVEEVACLYICHDQIQRARTAEHLHQWIARFESYLDKIKLSEPPVTLILSELPVSWGDESAENLDYLKPFLLSHSRSPARGGTGHSDSNDTVLNVGIAPTLAGRENQDKLPAAKGMEHEAFWSDVYECLGSLWVMGYPVDWAALYEGSGRQVVMLPTYPFERVRCWIESSADERSDTRVEPANEVLPVVQHVLSPEQLENYEAPRNSTERVLAYLWETYLGIRPIGIQDNYYELGGNSLLAATLTAKINEMFQTDIGLDVFLGHQVITELAEAIESGYMESTPTHLESGRT